MKLLATLFAAATLAGCASNPEMKSDPNAADPQRVFARLKLLVGKWSAQPTATPTPAPTTTPTDATKPADAAKADTSGEDPRAATIPVEYTLTSGGHVVQEKLLAGTNDEMITMYYLEGDGLALVHYCSMGNRPHMRLDVAHSTRDDFRFEWDNTATDINPRTDAHIHNGRIHFIDADTIECEWAFWIDGKEAHRREFTLSRTNGGFTPPAKQGG